MNHIAKPHISEAVKQLRRWVTLAAATFALCAAAQMLVFGFVQYTNIRWTEVREIKTDRSLKVIAPAAPLEAANDPNATPSEQAAASPPVEASVVAGVRGQTGDRKAAVEVNRVLTAADRTMSRASNLACGIGLIAATCLTLLTMLGVAVAGGGSVPGVERAVTACVWSMVLMLVCLPWDRLLPDLGLPGVFASYNVMTATADHNLATGENLGSFAAFCQWVAAPGIALFTSLGICLWFRAGVEKGVIITAPSELDKAVAREVELIQKRGASATAPRSVGALNRAIGEEPVSDNTPSGSGRTLSAIERAIEDAAATASSLADEADSAVRPRRTRSVVDADYKRPI